jgi:NADH-quinone oxidoreductase subunit E
MISESTKARFAKEVAKYPVEQAQSAVMACLSIVQQELGYVSPESEKVVADYLGMAPMAVHEVTTFYNMYNQRPVGKYKLNVCTNLPCQLRDGQKALHHLENKAGYCPWVKPQKMACLRCSSVSVWGPVPILPLCW